MNRWVNKTNNYGTMVQFGNKYIRRIIKQGTSYINAFK